MVNEQTLIVINEPIIKEIQGQVTALLWQNGEDLTVAVTNSKEDTLGISISTKIKDDEGDLVIQTTLSFAKEKVTARTRTTLDWNQYGLFTSNDHLKDQEEEKNDYGEI